ncbi:MAG: T9SS type A sorting domain-containing protein [Flavobacteriales bacterium]
MKNAALLTTFILIGSLCRSQGTLISSVVQVNASIADLAVDGAGNTYVIGTFVSTLTLGDLVLTSAGASDTYLACLGPNGEWVWAERIGGTGSDGGTTVAVNGTYDLYVSTFVEDGPSLSVGTLPVPGFPNSGLALMRMNTAGEYQWATPASVGNLLNIRSVVTDQNVCYLGGTAFDHASLQFGAHVVGTTEVSGFLAACDGEGEWLWAKEYGQSLQSSCDGIATDPSGDLLATGRFGGPTLTLDGASLTGPPLSQEGGVYSSPYIGRWSSGGELQWLIKGDVGSDGDASTSSISATPDGGCALTGNYLDSLSFGNAHLTTGAFFMSAFDASGVCDMAADFQPFGDPFYPSDAVLLDDGSLLHAGYYAGDLHLGTLELLGNGHVAGFVGQCSTDNEWILAESALSTDQAAFHRLAHNGPHVRALGRFQQALFIGEDTYDPSHGTWFIALLAPLSTGVPEGFEKKPLHMYPNPAQERVSGGVVGESGMTLLRVFGPLGNTVITQWVDAASFDIGLIGLPAGIYVVSVRNSIARFVKE